MIGKRFLAAVFLLLALAAPSRSATLMVLADWYRPGTDSLVQVDSVWVPGWSGSGVSGYVLGGSNLVLSSSTAFAAPLLRTDSVTGTVHRLERRWFSIPSFLPGNFRAQILRFGARFHLVRSAYDSGAGAVLASNVVDSAWTSELNTPSGGGVRPLEACLDSLATDTVWIRARGAVSASPAAFDCFPADPFLHSGSYVRFFPPFPTTQLQSVQNGAVVKMVPDRRWPGWYVAPVLDSLGVAGPVVTTFRGDQWGGQIQTWDSAGQGWTIRSDSGATFWVAARTDGGVSAAVRDTVPGAPSLVVGFASGRFLQRVSGQRGLSGTSLPRNGDWNVQPLWERPAAVFGFDSNQVPFGPIPVPAKGDTLWILGDGAGSSPAASDSDTLWLPSAGFDFNMNYRPFAASGPDDNCVESGGGETQGLVQPMLGARGFPVWTGRVGCDIATTTDGPEFWFRDTFAVDSTTIRIPLVRAAGTAVWTYSNANFFPFDTVKGDTANHIGPNFNFCLEIPFQVVNKPGGYIQLGSDDDLWFFANNKLRIDLGGLHGLLSKRYDFSRLEQPEGAVVDMDVFKCDRHPTGSGFTLATNVLVHPGRSIAHETHPPTTALRRNLSIHPLAVLGGRRVQVAVGADERWILTVRGLDGRERLRRSGSGPASFQVDVTHGPWALELRASGARIGMLGVF